MQITGHRSPYRLDKVKQFQEVNKLWEDSMGVKKGLTHSWGVKNLGDCRGAKQIQRIKIKSPIPRGILGIPKVQGLGNGVCHFQGVPYDIMLSCTCMSCYSQIQLYHVYCLIIRSCMTCNSLFLGHVKYRTSSLLFITPGVVLVHYPDTRGQYLTVCQIPPWHDNKNSLAGSLCMCPISCRPRPD